MASEEEASEEEVASEEEALANEGLMMVVMKEVVSAVSVIGNCFKMSVRRFVDDNDDGSE